jgi:UV DNA damage endonuclease
VLENDDLRYSAADVLAIHALTGVPLVFDHQHFWCNNPEQLDLADTARRFLATWQPGCRPKVHFSSPRTELREVKRKDRPTGKPTTALLEPIWTGHADFVNPFEFLTFVRLCGAAEFDVMIEAKAKDLAVMRLRRDLAVYDATLAARFGLEPRPRDLELADSQDADEVEVG